MYTYSYKMDFFLNQIQKRSEDIELYLAMLDQFLINEDESNALHTQLWIQECHNQIKYSQKRIEEIQETEK